MTLPWTSLPHRVVLDVSHRDDVVVIAAFQQSVGLPITTACRVELSYRSTMGVVRCFMMCVLVVGCGEVKTDVDAAAAVDAPTDPDGSTSDANLPDAAATLRSQDFPATGAMQTFVVPPGVSSIDVVALGAKGGCSNAGSGGEARATIAVTPGETLYVFVGGEGGCSLLGMIPGGFNGGGDKYTTSGDSWIGGSGGGASDVRRGGAMLGNRVVVAGGGGATGWNDQANGGVGGGVVGGDGNPVGGGCDDNMCAGKGGTQSSGGAGGNCVNAPGCVGLSGALGLGGRGTGCAASGGGGGGGYYGGGGGGHCAAGGGSSKADFPGNTNVSTTANLNPGPGLVTLSWLE